MNPAMIAAIPTLLVLAGCGGSDASTASGKWTADAHTHESVARMRSAFDRAAIDPDTADAKAYHELGDALQGEVDALIEGCRMTGPDHDRLHVWLQPLMNHVRVLRESQEVPALAKAHQGVAEKLTEFQELFKQ